MALPKAAWERGRDDLTSFYYLQIYHSHYKKALPKAVCPFVYLRSEILEILYFLGDDI